MAQVKTLVASLPVAATVLLLASRSYVAQLAGSSDPQGERRQRGENRKPGE